MSVSIDKDELDCSDFTHEQVQKILNWHSAQQKALLDKLEAQAEQQQIIFAYQKNFEHTPILKDVQFVPISAIDKLRQELNGEKV